MDEILAGKMRFFKCNYSLNLVCDPMRHLCLCPYGKTTNLEMLACTEVPAVLTGASYLPVQSQQPQQQTVQTFAPQNYPSVSFPESFID